MKRSSLGKIAAVALAAVLAIGGLSANVQAADTDVSAYCIEDEALKAEVDALVAEAAAEAENVEVVDAAKSTFVAFTSKPVLVVKYDGAAHGLNANAYKTVGGAYVADATELYIGATEDGTLYYSYTAPTEVGYYNVVAMYPGDADNYPSVAYGVVVILPECEEDPEVPVDPEDPEVPVDPEDPEVPVDPEDPEVPVDPEDPEVPVDPEDPADPTDPEEPADPENPTQNTTPEKPAESTAVKTGDTATFVVYIAAAAVAFAALMAVARKRA